MSIKLKTATCMAALIAGVCCVALPAAGAAGTGGAAAPAAAPRASKSRIHTTGIATWFGPGFYGKKTACGQTLTPSVIGVANRTLPCGTLVKVAYKGRALTLPVLDRGPYSRADWDLTGGAAHALAVADTVRISTRIVGVVPNSPALGLPAGAPTPAPALAGGAVAG
jgi:peptidoglycan lytic transglycosylase